MSDNVTMTAEAEVVAADEMRELMLVVRRALLMIVRWIEKQYEIGGE